jgi:membrane associated rhomboid family serine protease
MSSADPTPAATTDRLLERTWGVPWHAHLLPGALAVLLLVSWYLTPEDKAMSMALSWAGLQQGNTASIWLYMFAHGSFFHVFLNCAALMALSGPLVARLGDPPLSWGRYIYLYLGSGLAGAALFLALNHSAAMLGASGAIFGIFGALARVHPHHGTLVPVKSHRTWLLAKAFVRDHLFMFGVLVLSAFILGKSASIAWQAHLGGLLFGVFAASFFLEKRAQPAVIDDRCAPEPDGQETITDS